MKTRQIKNQKPGRWQDRAAVNKSDPGDEPSPALISLSHQCFHKTPARKEKVCSERDGDHTSYTVHALKLQPYFKPNSILIKYSGINNTGQMFIPISAHPYCDFLSNKWDHDITKTCLV